MKIPHSDRAKLASAWHALQFVESGMQLGLGTGSTAAWLVKLLGRKIREDGFKVVCVPTSTRTEDLAVAEGVPITTLDEAGGLDLTIDGADEFDPSLSLIKGGGGALLQEKIVATASGRMIVIADDAKEVKKLGAFPLPVEVVRFGWETTRDKVEEVVAQASVKGRDVRLRQDMGRPFITDEGHYILDLHLRQIDDPDALAAALVAVPGVVETGLFIDIADTVVLGYADGHARILHGDGPETVTDPVDLEALF